MALFVWTMENCEVSALLDDLTYHATTVDLLALASLRDQCIFGGSAHLIDGGGAIVLNLAATGNGDGD